MGPAVPSRTRVGPEILERLRLKVEEAKRQFEAAPPNDKSAALLRLDRAVTHLTEALLYGKLGADD